MERDFQFLEFCTRVGKKVDTGLSVVVSREKNGARREENGRAVAGVDECSARQQFF